VESENRVLKKAIKQNNIIETYRNINHHKSSYNASFDTILNDMMFEYKYFQQSVYSSFVSEYREHLGQNVKIVVFEELINKPSRVLGNILEFAGLNEEKSCMKLLHKNETFIPKSKIARNILKKWSANYLAGYVSQVAKFIGFKHVGRCVKRNLLKRSKTKLSKSHYEKARDILRSEYKYWKTKRPRISDYWNY